MKSFLSTILIGFLVPSGAQADLTLTQQVHQEAPPQEMDMTMTMKMKAGRLRVDVGSQMSTIIDLKTQDTTSLMHEEKVVMTIPGSAVKGMQESGMASGLAAAAKAEPPKPTGRKETISGYNCEEYETKSDGMLIQLWLTKDLPAAEKLMDEMEAMSSTPDPMRGALKNSEISGFPMRTVISPVGAGKTTITVVALTENAIPDSEFVVPKNYRAMEMPAMPGQ